MNSASPLQPTVAVVAPAARTQVHLQLSGRVREVVLRLLDQLPLQLADLEAVLAYAAVQELVQGGWDWEAMHARALTPAELEAVADVIINPARARLLLNLLEAGFRGGLLPGRAVRVLAPLLRVLTDAVPTVSSEEPC